MYIYIWYGIYIHFCVLHRAALWDLYILLVIFINNLLHCINFATPLMIANMHVYNIKIFHHHLSEYTSDGEKPQDINNGIKIFHHHLSTPVMMKNHKTLTTYPKL